MATEEHSLHTIIDIPHGSGVQSHRVDPLDNNLRICSGNMYDDGTYDEVVMHPVWKRLPSDLQLRVVDGLCQIAKDQCSWLEEDDQSRNSELE